MSFDFDWILNCNNEIKHEFIHSSDIFQRTDLEKYINALSNYNKYNKLNVLKTKTKLNDDIIFNIIIKYL